MNEVKFKQLHFGNDAVISLKNMLTRSCTMNPNNAFQVGYFSLQTLSSATNWSISLLLFPKVIFSLLSLAHSLSYSIGFEDNFVKLVENVTIDHLGTEYDYNSVMHYPGDAFAINEDIPTIITRDPDAQDEIGQRVRMSEADIERVQVLYSCVAAVSAK